MTRRHMTAYSSKGMVVAVASPVSLGKSGIKVTLVKSAAPSSNGVISASFAADILSSHVCRYSNPLRASAVSTVNLCEKILVNFAPYPCLPPVIRLSESLKLDPVIRCPKTISGTYIFSFRWIWTGMPLPSLYTLMSGGRRSVPSAQPGSMVTSTRLHDFGCRSRLSDALTSISSNTLFRAGTKLHSLRTMRMLLRSSADEDGEGHEVSGRVSGTQHVVGGNRSVGPTYIPGRSSTCSTGVLRLYCSSMLSCRSFPPDVVDFNLTNERAVGAAAGARCCCWGRYQGCRATTAAARGWAAERHG